MSNLNNILSKIEKANKIEEIKLASQKIELALIDDLKKIMNRALGRKTEFQKFSQNIQQQLDNLKASSNMWNKDLLEGQTLVSNLVIKAKEIGVAIPSEVLAYEKIIKDGVAETKNYSNIIAKIKSELPKG